MIARLADIAAAAGVSTATVSRVLNERPGVAQATRNQVLVAAGRLGIPTGQPSAARDRHVAVLIPELGNPTFAAFANELSLLLSAAGRVMLLLVIGPSRTAEEQMPDVLCGLDVPGVISVSGTLADELSSPERYLSLNRAGIQLVSINAWHPEVTGSFLSTDDAAAVTQSVAHLRSLGHTRIGLAVGQRRYQPTARKVAAFLDLGFDESSVVSTFFTGEGGQSAAARLLDAGHTAIVCGSDVMALGAMREVRSRGLDIPGDVSVVGFDDSPLMPFTAPALTPVRQPVAALCRAAVDALLSALERPPAEATEMLFHPDLIIRQSTGPAA